MVEAWAGGNAKGEACRKTVLWDASLLAFHMFSKCSMRSGGSFLARWAVRELARGTVVDDVITRSRSFSS